MHNVILERIALLFLRVMILVSFWLLFRGHHEPGGGFIAGIIASTGFILYAIVFGSTAIETIIKYNTRNWIGTGLIVICASIIIPVFAGYAPMTGLWFSWNVFADFSLHIGTPILFDIGVYIAVIGAILSIIITIMEMLKWNS